MSEKPIEYFLDQINPDNRDKCIKLHNHFTTNYSDAKWSLSKHQAWNWWYNQHIKDILNISERLFFVLNNLWDLDYKIEDTYLVLFLHDIEKPIKYTKNRTHEVLYLEKLWTYEIRDYFLEKYNIILNDDIKLALKYIHWEWNEYSSTKRLMTPLWAHCHSCDTISARILYDKDKK